MRYENNLTLKPGAHWASLTADKNLITGNSFLLCQKKSADLVMNIEYGFYDTCQDKLKLHNRYCHN